MQSRETRFVLRIDSGERQGEEIPLAQGTLQVGRRADCGLVLRDGSVSGKHAELRVEGERIEVVDLGSTNGTRVSGQKIEHSLLSHGDAVLFGNVRATLRDARIAGEPPAAATAAPPSAVDAEGLGQVSAEKVTRSSAGAKRSWLLLLPLVVLGGAALAYLRFLRPEGSSEAPVAVPAVPGNLVADGSFEEGSGEWSSAETATVAFLRERNFARSGEVGLGALLEGGWSFARSAEFALPARRSLANAVALRVDDGAVGRFGVELTSSTQALPPFHAWAPARRVESSFQELELRFDVPTGYDRGRLVVAGEGRGAVAFDDVSAIAREPLGGAAEFAEYELGVLGAPGSSAVLFRSHRPLIVGIDLSSWTRSGLEGWPDARLEARAGPYGFRLVFPGAPPDARLGFTALRLDESPAGGDDWAATMGAEGYLAHGGDFTRKAVTSVLLGSGTELLRLGFERAIEVGATAVEGGLAFRVLLGGNDSCEIQLTFGAERAEASAMADRAADTERAGDLGQALAQWTELLDRIPFERKLVARASEARARLVQTGLDEAGELRREMERARFFRLSELFEQGRARARALAGQYAGSEVEAEAVAVVEFCERALTELATGHRLDDERRLQGVLEALDPDSSPRLLEHVKGALRELEGGAVPGGGEGD